MKPGGAGPAKSPLVRSFGAGKWSSHYTQQANMQYIITRKAKMLDYTKKNLPNFKLYDSQSHKPVR